jgi:hypothetical protein
LGFIKRVTPGKGRSSDLHAKYQRCNITSSGARAVNKLMAALQLSLFDHRLLTTVYTGTELVKHYITP